MKPSYAEQLLQSLQEARDNRDHEARAALLPGTRPRAHESSGNKKRQGRRVLIVGPVVTISER
jgi:hypothetical protein